MSTPQVNRSELEQAWLAGHAHAWEQVWAILESLGLAAQFQDAAFKSSPRPQPENSTGEDPRFSWEQMVDAFMAGCQHGRREQAAS